MKIRRTLIRSVLWTLASVLLLPSPSHALFHVAVIDEVLASHDGDPDQQFVEILMRFDAQNLVSNSVLAAFDASGVYVADILIVPEDVPNGQNGRRWVMATSAFQDASSFTADFTMPAGIPLGGGMVCWGAPGLLPPADPSSWDHTNPANYVDCLAYGTYSGPSNSLIGTPTSLVAEGHSLARRSETHDNAADFACAETATPTNNAGETVEVQASTPCGSGRSSGIQVTPDGEGVLVNKDVQDQRWTITRNLGDLTVTGNVFFPEGGNPLFLFCEQQDEVGDDLELRCSGADACSDSGCPEFAFIADVVLPESFFAPPVDAAAVGERIGQIVLAARGSPAGAESGQVAGGLRGSGIQITPDQQRVLVNKDVEDQRWSITRNLGDLTVTGNVFFTEGSAPLFLFCEQTGQVGDSLELRCSGADGCSDTACPPYELIADVTLPESFFALPSPGPTPTSQPSGMPTPVATPVGTASPSGSQGPTDTPGPTETPEPTESPEPSESPEPTPTYSYPYP